MFGLHNFSGSCWVNSCLQALFRIPEVQTKYSDETSDNKIDESLQTIWKSKGEQGLKEFFDSVKTVTMPAGDSIGDAHELFQYLCDKLKFLDDICRFKIADTIKCNSCSYSEIKEDSVIEFSVSTNKHKVPLIQCISETVTPYKIDDWKCEKCSAKGCTKQQLIGSFPKVMIFHKTSVDGSIDYPSILVLNNQEYALIAVCCWNGGHWWTYGRNMPPGSSWFTLNDTRVSEHGPKQFPVCPAMRVLIYYRLEK